MQSFDSEMSEVPLTVNPVTVEGVLIAAAVKAVLEVLTLLLEVTSDLTDLLKCALAGSFEFGNSLLSSLLVAIADTVVVTTHLLAVGLELVVGSLDVAGSPGLDLLPLKLVDLVEVVLFFQFLVLLLNSILVLVDLITGNEHPLRVACAHLTKCLVGVDSSLRRLTLLGVPLTN